MIIGKFYQQNGPVVMRQVLEVQMEFSLGTLAQTILQQSLSGFYRLGRAKPK
jgi:hypothetical protein